MGSYRTPGAVAVLLATTIAASAHASTYLYSYQAALDAASSAVLASQYQTSATDAKTIGSIVLDGLTFAAYSEADSTPLGISFHAKSSLSGTYTGSSSEWPDAASSAGLTGIFEITSPDQSGNGKLFLRLAYDGSESGSTTAGVIGSYAGGVVCATNSTCTSTSPQLSTTALSVNQGSTYNTAKSGTATLGGIDFTYGVPFDLSVYLVENTTLYDAPTGATVTGDTDFANTATLLPIQVFNSNGTLDTKAVIQSTDNPSFQLSTAVPEPSTWSMMLLGSLGLGALLRGRRKSLAAP